MSARHRLVSIVLVLACDATTDDTASRRADVVDDPAVGFVPRVDFGGGFDGCRTWSQNCGPGDKCVFAFSASPETRCVDVVRAPGRANEPCTFEYVADGLFDDCARGLECVPVNGSDAGQCRRLCVGGPSSLVCLDPDETCLQDDSDHAICARTCDPLARDCDEGFVCTGAWHRPFACLLDASGRLGSLFDPCYVATMVGTCDPGLACVPGSFVGACTDVDGCCTSVCDLRAPQCPAGLGCVPYYTDYHGQPAAPDGLDHLGVCLEAT